MIVPGVEALEAAAQPYAGVAGHDSGPAAGCGGHDVAEAVGDQAGGGVACVGERGAAGAGRAGSAAGSSRGFFETRVAGAALERGVMGVDQSAAKRGVLGVEQRRPAALPRNGGRRNRCRDRRKRA